MSRKLFWPSFTVKKHNLIEIDNERGKIDVASHESIQYTPTVEIEQLTAQSKGQGSITAIHNESKQFNDGAERNHQSFYVLIVTDVV